MSTDPADLRIGDAEREAATAELGDHYAAGRLDHEEYAERLDAIWAARTRRELDPPFVDLRPQPAYVAPWVARHGNRPAARAASWSPRRRPRVPVPLLVLAAVVVAVALLAHLPLLLLGAGAWLLLRRGSCSRSMAPHRSRWS